MGLDLWVCVTYIMDCGSQIQYGSSGESTHCYTRQTTAWEGGSIGMDLSWLPDSSMGPKRIQKVISSIGQEYINKHILGLGRVLKLRFPVS